MSLHRTDHAYTEEQQFKRLITQPLIKAHQMQCLPDSFKAVGIYHKKLTPSQQLFNYNAIKKYDSSKSQKLNRDL